MPIFDLFELLKSIPTFQRHFLFFSGSDAPWEGGGRPPSEMSPARPPDSGATLAAQERALAVLEEERDIARRSVCGCHFTRVVEDLSWEIIASPCFFFIQNRRRLEEAINKNAFGGGGGGGGPPDPGAPRQGQHLGFGSWEDGM